MTLVGCARGSGGVFLLLSVPVHVSDYRSSVPS